MKVKELLIYKLLLIIQLIAYVLAFIFCIWTSKLIKIVFYLTFTYVSFSCIYSFIYIYISFDLKFNFIQNSKIFKCTYFLFGNLNSILNIVIILSHNLYYLNNYHFRQYLKDCPFTLSSDLISNNTLYNEEHRCELYNIYTNSRYKYQYICSYNASKNFEDDKSDNGLDKIICIPKINNILNNDIINKFSLLYHNNASKLFYCNRINYPQKNSLIKDEYCNNKRNYPYLFYILFLIIQILSYKFNSLYKDLQDDLLLRITNDLVNETQRLLNRENDNCSTDNDENNSNNISFDEENNRNIIVENNEVSNVDINIKDCIKNEGKQKLD